MNHKKRIAVVLSVILLCMSLFACKMPQIRITGTSYPTTPEDTTIQGDAPASAASDLASNPEGYSYRNGFFNLTCTVPEDWYVFNHQELLQVFGVVDDLSNQNETLDGFQSMVESELALYDFYALTIDGKNSINVVISYITLVDALASEQHVLDESSAAIITMMEDLGTNNLSTCTGKIQFCGKEHIALSVQGDYNGEKKYEKILFIRRGLSVFAITVSSSAEDTTDDILGYWSELR